MSSQDPLAERLADAVDAERRAQGLPPADRNATGDAAPAAAFGHQLAAETMLLRSLAYGAWLAAAAFLMGLFLVLAGAVGVTTVTNNGSSISTNNVGVAALLIGAGLFAFCTWISSKTVLGLAQVKSEGEVPTNPVEGTRKPEAQP